MSQVEPAIRPTAAARLGPAGSAAARIWTIRLLLIGVFVAVWKIAGTSGFLNPVFIGTPEGTFFAFFDQLYGPRHIWMDIGYTYTETVIGFLLGSGLGILVGMVLFQSPPLRQAVAPLVIAANSLPRVALAPLFVLWFGLGITGKVALIISLVFFVMLTTTLAGLTQPNRDYEYLSRSIGSTKRQYILYFIVPAAVPTIVAGLELSLTYSFLGAVAGEIVGGSFGVGVRLTAFANAFEINRFMALLVLLVILSTATVQTMRHFTSRLTRWHAAEQMSAD